MTVGAMLVIMLSVGIILYLFAEYAVKNGDNKKPLKKQRVRVLEKNVQKISDALILDWLVLECENGERIRLKNAKRDTLLISVGDQGIVEYRGQTIQSFHRT